MKSVHGNENRLIRISRKFWIIVTRGNYYYQHEQTLCKINAKRSNIRIRVTINNMYNSLQSLLIHEREREERSSKHILHPPTLVHFLISLDLLHQLSLPSSEHLPPGPNNTEATRLTIEAAGTMIEKNRGPRFLARSEILLSRDEDASLRGKEKRRGGKKRKGEKKKKGGGGKEPANPADRSARRPAPGPARLINGHVRLINGVSATNHCEAAATGINTNYTSVAGRAPEAAKGSRGVP